MAASSPTGWLFSTTLDSSRRETALSLLFYSWRKIACLLPAYYNQVLKLASVGALGAFVRTDCLKASGKCLTSSVGSMRRLGNAPIDRSTGNLFAVTNSEVCTDYSRDSLESPQCYPDSTPSWCRERKELMGG